MAYEPAPAAVAQVPSRQTAAILATESTYPAAGRAAVYVPAQVAAMLPSRLSPSARLQVTGPAPRTLLRRIALDQRYPASRIAAIPEAPSVPAPARKADARPSPWEDFFADEERRGGADPAAVTPAGTHTPIDDEFETEGPPLPPGWDESWLRMPVPAALTVRTRLAQSPALAPARES